MLILVIPSVRVVVVRIKVHRSFGDGGEDTLQPVIRGQGNFIEYVPLSLLLMGYLEFSGTYPYLIHGLGIALVVARILHPFGLQKDRGPTVAELPQDRGGCWTTLPAHCHRRQWSAT